MHHCTDVPAPPPSLLLSQGIPWMGSSLKPCKQDHPLILDWQGFTWDHEQAEDKQNLTALFQSDQKYVMCAYLLWNTSFIYNYNVPNEYLSLAGAIVRRK